MPRGKRLCKMQPSITYNNAWESIPFEFVDDFMEQLDAMLRADYEAWVQYMKDAGAWHGR
jgi:hypothetical protein